MICDLHATVLSRVAWLLLCGFFIHLLRSIRHSGVQLHFTASRSSKQRLRLFTGNESQRSPQQTSFVINALTNKRTEQNAIYEVAVPIAARSRHRSAAARLLRLWVRIPPGAMNVSCECCVLSGRGLCAELITRPGESYRM